MYARLTVAAATFSLLAALPAHAQLCAGAAPYTTGKMQATGQLISNDDISSYGVGLNFGTARGYFGGPQIANTEYKSREESGLSYGASGGYQMRPARKGYQICPVAAIGFGGVGSGSSEISVRQFSAGAIIGMVAHRDRDFRIIPTGGLSIINEKVTVGTRDNSETFFTLNMGAGIVVNSVWTIRPMISMPFNDDSNRDDTMSLGVWYNFGRRAPAR